MKVSQTITEPRFKTAIDTKAGLIDWGGDNNYPNIIKMVSNASPTAQKCLKTYVRFLVGKGFTDLNLNKFVVDAKKRTTVIALFRKIAYDYALFKGVSVQVKFKSEGSKYGLVHVPFENCRLGKPDDLGYINRKVTNKDFLDYKSDNNQFVYNYDLKNVVKQIVKVVSEKGSIDFYRGQIYWWSQEGLSYPLSTIDSVATDCSTEEGLQNIRYRNTRFNFLPAGMLVTKGKSDVTNEHPEAMSEPERVDALERQQKSGENFGDKFIASQGDKNTSKIVVVEIDFNEEKPEFIPFETKNFDKEFDFTEKSTTIAIGGVFNQPPILRCEDVGAGFGADAITNAYNMYNAVLETERIELGEIMKELLSNFIGANFTDFTIVPLEYQGNAIPPELYKDMTPDERRNIVSLPPLPSDIDANKKMLAEILGVGGTQAMTAIMIDSVLSNEQKRQLLIQLFNIPMKNAKLLIPENGNTNNI